MVEPYQQLVDLNNSVSADIPTDVADRQAIELLRTIMTTKLVPSAEQEDRIGIILGRTANHALAAELGLAVR